MNKKIRSVLIVGLISTATLVLAGCSSQSNGMMNTSNMTQYMTSNPSAMVDILSSPDTRQSMVKIMGSSQMLPVMTDVMKDSNVQKNMIGFMGSSQNQDAMVSIMSNPSMYKPMVQIMADPRMKTTFETMLKDPALQPLVKEALGSK
ncbi:hypothetical protein Desaci_3901 [Desulfosporosinus acidiphilus SJ4]|uniref:Spore germination GerD central core domain-containing protein n=2 Tax=Desulfosporosinus TaxID=79206 RepID=I4DAF3_DESAJ|nr:hypothetical protein Desaci_3901 [Desulfosporosinus acidiphilus SJ4]